jgi:agmatine/peptidylarginine deiminase
MTDADFRLPAEWEPQSAVLLAWPHAGTDWAPRLGEVEDSYVALVAAIARFQPALVVVADDDLEAYARARLASARIDMDRVRFVHADYDDTWLRDTGPITLVAAGADIDTESDARAAAPAPRFRLLDFRFTGWGGKFEAGRDDRLVAQLQAAGLFAAAERRPLDFALEGGAIDTDGAGTLLTTWQCLRQRHPDAERAALAARLRDWLRQDRVLWLDHGHLEGDDTDAHVDTLARFAAPDAIVHQACDDPADSHYPSLRAMAVELAALRTADGRPYRLFPLPWQRPIHDPDGRRLAASYANFLIVDGAVLMPAYGATDQERAIDDRAAQVLAQAFPDREIVPVPCRPLIWQNGSLHCVTMQLPRGVLAPEPATA